MRTPEAANLPCNIVRIQSRGVRLLPVASAHIPFGIAHHIFSFRVAQSLLTNLCETRERSGPRIWPLLPHLFWYYGRKLCRNKRIRGIWTLERSRTWKVNEPGRHAGLNFSMRMKQCSFKQGTNHALGHDC
jgi:hypothetical protein